MKNKVFTINPHLMLAMSLSVLILTISSTVIAGCDYSLPASTPTEQFTAHGDGTVTDNKTGLTWKVCSEGQNWDPSRSNPCWANGFYDGVQFFTWEGAQQQAQTVNNNGGFAGHRDWRVPTITELRSIQELRCSLPSINTEVFGIPDSNHARYYWSSTRSAADSNEAWFYTFYAVPDSLLRNTRQGKTTSSQLRLVRN